MVIASFPSPYVLANTILSLRNLLTVPGAAQISSRLSHGHSDLYKAKWTPHQVSLAATLGHICHCCCPQSHWKVQWWPHTQDWKMCWKKVKSPETKSGLYTIQNGFIIKVIVNVTWHSEGTSAVSRWLWKGDKWAQQAQKKPSGRARKRTESSFHQSSLCLLFRHRGLRGTSHRVLI